MAMQKDQVISINYELKIEGEVVDSNIGKDALEFTFDSEQLIPGLESRMIDMNEGETREINVPAAEAYGEHNPAMKQIVPIEQFGGLELEVGMPMQGQGQNGESIQVVITEILEDTVEVDSNHPLAGKDLDFTVTVLSIK
ncbi:FKBP-type peptidyl-prolyl cis-trans isomerase [Poseidonibacter lekithochrous]|uniref:FKBP-type peptidyl-prolyl cis-trans isomerase n=1 Tax=Poseidonibacter lekithochrous TaxID=1904463 RepID=UPI0008FC7A7D|nr:peptidylprolyl isomerase [Poseidonibacter lekithochrous]QKJ22871.1 FKBP-type peptidyl-prolyl cis-trans isomerase [Poseidonibacter lekithochrous]